MESRAQFQIRRNAPVAKQSQQPIPQPAKVLKPRAASDLIPNCLPFTGRQQNQRNMPNTMIQAQIEPSPPSVPQKAVAILPTTDASQYESLLQDHEKIKIEFEALKQAYRRQQQEKRRLERENQELKLQLQQRQQGEEPPHQQFQMQDAYSLVLALRLQEREQAKMQYYQFMQEAMQPQTSDPHYPNVDNMTYEQLLELEEKMGHVSRGLTKEQIKSLKKTKVTLQNRARLPDNCSICFSEFKMDEKFRQLGCRHSYHSKCIKQWLGNEKKCPICKTEVNIEI